MVITERCRNLFSNDIDFFEIDMLTLDQLEALVNKLVNDNFSIEKYGVIFANVLFVQV